MLHGSHDAPSANLHMSTKRFSKLLAATGLARIKLHVTSGSTSSSRTEGFWLVHEKKSTEQGRELQSQVSRESRLRHEAGQQLPGQSRQRAYTVEFLLRQTKENHALSRDGTSNMRKGKDRQLGMLLTPGKKIKTLGHCHALICKQGITDTELVTQRVITVTKYLRKVPAPSSGSS